VDVLILLVFASLILVVGALVMLLARLRGGDFDHMDRLSLFPLEPDSRDPIKNDKKRTGEEDLS
jgi:hypothetical protein